MLNFKNETGYAKRPTYKPPPPQPVVVSKPAATTELPISEKLTASPSTSAATPAQTPLSSAVRSSSAATSAAEAEAKEADKPVGKASPSYEKAAHTEPAVESDTHSDIPTKIGDDEAEVPPPPGTEPPLLPKRPSDQAWRDRESSTETRDEEYRDRDRERYSRERRRSFSRDNHRDT